MAQNPAAEDRPDRQAANPFNANTEHCHECYQKALAWDTDYNYTERRRTDAFMRALEVLELDAGKCSQALRDEAERVMLAEFAATYPAHPAHVAHSPSMVSSAAMAQGIAGQGIAARRRDAWTFAELQASLGDEENPSEP